MPRKSNSLAKKNRIGMDFKHLTKPFRAERDTDTEGEPRDRPSNSISRVYDPHTLSIMAIAFDRACDFLPFQFRDSDYMRRKLASHIIRHVNDGESDPTRLADSAIVSIFW